MLLGGELRVVDVQQPNLAQTAAATNAKSLGDRSSKPCADATLQVNVLTSSACYLGPPSSRRTAGRGCTAAQPGQQRQTQREPRQAHQVMWCISENATFCPGPHAAAGRTAGRGCIADQPDTGSQQQQQRQQQQYQVSCTGNHLMLHTCVCAFRPGEEFNERHSVPCRPCLCHTQ
jgi:hypothetical protein